MTNRGLKFALLLSVLLNLGVIGAVTYRAFQHGGWQAIFSVERGYTSLPDHLKLDAGQRIKWEALEAGFLQDLKTEWPQIRGHRETMIREIFSDQPDRARIESERVAIAELQAVQQRRIIEQLLQERDILDPEQRRRLAELLLRQAPASTFEEHLHGK